MRQVPFYANTADDTHRVQAAFRIMLKYFLPQTDFDWPKLDKITHKLKGKGTWWFAALPTLSQMGLQVRLIECFDYEKFYQDAGYVLNFFRPELAEWHLEKTNLVSLRPLVPEFTKTVDWRKRTANLADLDKLLADGWLCAINVNARTLNEKPDSAGM
jgi:hypothetical protein